VALAITLLTTTINTGNNTTITSASISPTANALIVVVPSFNDSAGNNFASIADTFTGTGSWTKNADGFFDNYDGGNNDAGIAVYTAQAGSSPGSGTITVTHDAASARKLLHIYEVTGFNTTPVGVTGSNTGTGSTTLTVTASGSPASDSLMVGGVFSLEPAVPAGDLGVDGAYTEGAETQTTGGANLLMLSVYDNGGADSDVQFSNIVTTGDDAAGGVLVEIKIAAAGGGFQVAWARGSNALIGVGQ